MPADSASMSERSLRPFSSTEKYLLAVREDLAEWLDSLYPDCGIDAESFFAKLETGVLLCKHINALIERLNGIQSPAFLLPAATRYAIHCRTNVQPGTFQARDNICSCLRWCRAMQMKECLLFETDDLVLRKNEKSVILCLMEVARIGARLGLPVPTLIQFEREIDADELRHATSPSSSSAAGSYSSCSEDIDDVASSLSNESSSGGSSLAAISAESLSSAPVGMTTAIGTTAPSLLPSSLKNVDQVVKEQMRECRCQKAFPLIKVAPGKYRVGPSNLIIYVRILRNHVMVRVGGGWDTLDHFLEKHDPCRRRGCCNEPLRSVTTTAPPSLLSTGSAAVAGAGGVVKSSQPPTQPSVRRQKTDLTPLQVVFNRDCSATLPSRVDAATVATHSKSETRPLSSRSSLPVAGLPTKAAAFETVVTKRRISQPPVTGVQLRRPYPGAAPTARAPRARSMDVGLLLDKFKASDDSSSKNPAAPPPVKSNYTKLSSSRLATPKVDVTIRQRRASVTFEDAPVPEGLVKALCKKSDPVLRKKRSSLMELENIPSGLREEAIVVHDRNDKDGDRWDTAFNRHRQNFLRIKNIFGGSRDFGGNPFQGDGDETDGNGREGTRIHNRRLGSPSSPDSASDDAGTLSCARKIPLNEGSVCTGMNNRRSVEEGFFSDASWKSG
ncbi:GAS2-like protein 1 [Hypsibius exemplaris]|uniref:GAS2-like protein 1 n=1 Tax=Hypsibius exemplaris TaxID=2072580 RepID=A0A9X6NHV4_HYPEX|nr:GAS2-like protein 1 [Hypsibius exemplaris]